MPRLEEGREVLSLLLYDSITLGGAVTSATLFTEPVGQSSKTFYHTNMTEAGKLPYPDTFTFESVRFGCAPDLTDVQVAGLLNGVLSLVIGHKSYLDVPLFTLGQGAGIHYTAGASQVLVEGTPNTFTAAVNYGQAGQPRQMAIRSLATPLSLEPGEGFRVDLQWASAPGALLFWIAFDGTYRRPIQ